METEYFSYVPLGNAMALCVGAITDSEAALAREDGIVTDGLGYFLFLARADAISTPIEVLAQFASIEAAEKLILLMGVSA
jgi:hypothetical protein